MRASDVLCWGIAVAAIGSVMLGLWSFGLLQRHLPQEPACKLHR